MLVLRMESPEGDGPFEGYALDMMYEAARAHGLTKTHCGALPCPWVDGLGEIDDDEVCGCANARQFVRWFPRPVRKAIEPLGFGLSVYDVPDDHVRSGAHQVVFKRHEAARLAKAQ